jgi:hypothetical protein|tara:strand:- start:100 stop:228 length:129 start_codon:yes stop_codon:yes gene_type:complete
MVPAQTTAETKLFIHGRVKQNPYRPQWCAVIDVQANRQLLAL